ncbi:DegQ family serine endoprotease [Geomonas sp. Red32]|uniref:DegQ family serine endoprotease n=1 Tax=Geomonas sp. Red32 TaxID=2912856 RepID=UPI00202CE1AA|nr:DegQ family serine endoprotease [Geomonas sp. Red32]MCM0082610.1 DegQ family serine endoprotease [Geomonas sp. Red32]
MKLITTTRLISRGAMVLLVAGATLLGGCKKDKPAALLAFPRSFSELAEKVQPAVVNIRSTSTVTVPGDPFLHFFGRDGSAPGQDDFFGNFFHDVPDRAVKQQSLGSGFIIDRNGYIITNNHVVDKADEIKVKLSDGREFTAKVVGRDSKTDLALIKISSTFRELPVLPLGDSDKMRVGDWVLAVGNPFGLEHTVTQGIISATGRVIGSGPYDNFLQTDAPINPGNSGGPLINMQGEVIGINTAIIQGGQGIGFAIPSNLAKSVSSQIREKGKVTRGWLGVSIQTVTPELAQSLGLKEPKGALVSSVMTNSPASAAGIHAGDVVISCYGHAVANANDLPRIVAEAPVGKEIAITVIRDGAELPLRVTLKDASQAAEARGTLSSQADLGVTVKPLDHRRAARNGIAKGHGVVVAAVDEDGPAGAAGIRPGDVILEVNRKPIRGVQDFLDALSAGRTPLLILLQRGGTTFFVTVG